MEVIPNVAPEQPDMQTKTIKTDFILPFEDQEVEYYEMKIVYKRYHGMFVL